MNKTPTQKAVTRYYSVKDALAAPATSHSIFVIANERATKEGGVGRYYTVFPSFKLFLTYRHKFPHCHELLVDHPNNKPITAGRLVFDFDIKKKADGKTIPKGFKGQIEDIILEVCEQYFEDIDTSRFIYIWSSSSNPNKVSKHLTVKHLYFDDWIKLSKIFYQLFSITWDAKYKWIQAEKLIDTQIIRRHGSLRMVGSTKIGGFPLTFDDTSHTLTDSLIRIYSKTERKSEQLVCVSNLADGVLEDVLEWAEPKVSSHTSSTHTDHEACDPAYPLEVFKSAFDMYDETHKGIFSMGKINGHHMSLIRQQPSKCAISGRQHDSDNAYLLVFNDADAVSPTMIAQCRSEPSESDSDIDSDIEDTESSESSEQPINASTTPEVSYSIRFACFRYCGGASHRTIRLGRLRGSDLTHELDNAFYLRFKVNQGDDKKAKTKPKKPRYQFQASYLDC
ncbi:Hypothetical protein MVR_LOCUS244 [uncultured virus]|nr:Hypothetical protein MVR_LOCUS244 [uncultured virus]